MPTIGVAQATAMATFRRRRGAGLTAVALGLLLIGCGGHKAGAGSGGQSSRTDNGSLNAGGFTWLRAAPAPAGWQITRIPTGAAMAYPPGWHRLHGDSGTATAALLDRAGGISGYLNLTPRQGTETLSGWRRFRIEHNSEEGDRGVRLLASDARLRFRDGRGSCVRDAYTTKTSASYVEVACLVAGSRHAAVIVAAAPPAVWRSIGPSLERALSAVTL